MEDINGKIADILNDPASMDAIKSMAESIMGGGDDISSSPLSQSDLLKSISSIGGSSEDTSDRKSAKKETALSKKGGGIPDISGLLGSMSPDQLGGIMKIMTAINSGKNDDRTTLLMALRPHLSAKRQERLDRAVKLMKIASLMPLISESGLFSKDGLFRL